MSQICNPYLPLWEHVPDGEPHLFEGRVYIYGSHDRANNDAYCADDYVLWSAPETDLTRWEPHGIIYHASQDPHWDGRARLWAPDVTCGPDGRYYLYYCFAFCPEIGVASADSPQGPFAFLGHVHRPDGSLLGQFMPFDPAVLTDNDGRVYLYYGFAPAGDKEMKVPDLNDPALTDDERLFISRLNGSFGEDAMVLELEPDMVTMKEEPRVLIPGGHHTAGTGFEGHGFFEASSIRRVEGRYCFVYSSEKSHELCHAVSDRPDGGFVYKGTIVSNGDIGLGERTMPVYPLGNNHGGLVKAEDQWYIFYHRQTNGTEYSRQGCAEPVQILPDGTIPQVEITSCGLNRKPLRSTGMYPAAVCCHLTTPFTSPKICYQGEAAAQLQEQARIVEHDGSVYLTDLTDYTTVGWKFFDFQKVEDLLLEVRGSFHGRVTVYAGDNAAGGCQLDLNAEDWTLVRADAAVRDGTAALYLLFTGKGRLELRSIGFLNR